MKTHLLTLFLLMSVQAAFAQITVTGVVSSKDQRPLPGVNILLVGTDQGTSTDLDGQYRIQAPADGKLRFSMVGFSTIESEIPADGNLNVTLFEGVLLDNVVVTALGIERSKDALAYAHSEIDTKPLTLARENSLGDALVGLVPGVDVTNVAAGPASSSRIVIRGMNSISGNNQPLFVIDGIPIDNHTIGTINTGGGYDWGDGLTGLNPDDIEKISVLRGNAAAALYGSRASNGVVLITTKRGEARDGIGVEVNSNLTLEEPLTYFNWQKEFGQGWGPWKPNNQADAFGSNWFNWGPRMDGEELVQFDGVVRPYAPVDNDIRDFYRTGTNWNNSVALTGGSDQLHYRFGFANLDNDYIMPNSGYNRKTFTLATGGEILKNLTAEVTGRYILEDAVNRPRLGNSPGNAPYALAVLPAHVPLSALAGPNGDGSDENGNEIGVNGNPFITNPYWAAYRWRTEDNKERIIGSVKLRYDWGPLYVQGRVGTDRWNNRMYDLVPEGTAFFGDGIANNQTNRSWSNNTELIVGAKGNYKDFGVDLFVGANRFDYFLEFLGQGGVDFSIPNLPVPSNTVNQYQFSGSFQSRTNSLFASAGFYYQNWLYLTLTGRNDWFSTLPIDDNNLFYPSVGTSIVFSELIDLPDFFNYGKIYTSWAQVSSDVDPYSLDLSYGLHPVSFEGQSLGIITNQTIPDRELSPSTSDEVEVGLELRFFKQRLGLEAAFYDRRTRNDIIVSTISNASGFESAFVKDGAMRNRGVELFLTATPLLNRNWEWSTSLNFSKNWNEVTNLGTDVESIQLNGSVLNTAFLHHDVGQPASVIKGFSYVRDEADNIIFGADGLPLVGDFGILGNGVHDFIGGFNNIVRFRNISLGFLIDFKFGAEVLSASNAFGTLFGQHQQTLKNRENGFVGEGVTESGEPNTVEFDQANLLPYYSHIYNNIAEEWVYDADFVKLRQVVFTYRLPKTWFGRMPIAGASVSLVGRNLAILHSKVENIDPESAFNNTNAQGMETFGLPQTRSYGANLNVQF